jgi:hypothetical protein
VIDITIDVTIDVVAVSIGDDGRGVAAPGVFARAGLELEIHVVFAVARPPRPGGG